MLMLLVLRWLVQLMLLLGLSGASGPPGEKGAAAYKALGAAASQAPAPSSGRATPWGSQDRKAPEAPIGPSIASTGCVAIY